jgi:hypothetical protein
MNPKLTRKHLSTGLSILFILGVTAVGARTAYHKIQNQNLLSPQAPQAISIEEVHEQNANTNSSADSSDVSEIPENQEKITPPTSSSSINLLSSLNLDMVFYTQAPHSNWDYPWQEACEEASILLVANEYLNLNLDRDAYNEELLKLVDYEIETFGAYEHTNIEQTVQMIEDNYKLETRVHENPTFEDLQEIINRGNFIVAPFAGKLLFNPNFKNGGPTYHMLVIKGYDAEKNQVVTNDVGTRNGENYVYSWDTINAALHNWNDIEILNGEAQFIEVLAP